MMDLLSNGPNKCTITDKDGNVLFVGKIADIRVCHSIGEINALGQSSVVDFSEYRRSIDLTAIEFEIPEKKFSNPIDQILDSWKEYGYKYGR